MTTCTALPCLELNTLFQDESLPENLRIIKRESILVGWVSGWVSITNLNADGSAEEISITLSDHYYVVSTAS